MRACKLSQLAIVSSLALLGMACGSGQHALDTTATHARTDVDLTNASGAGKTSDSAQPPEPRSVPVKCGEPKAWPADGPKLQVGVSTRIDPPPFRYADESGFGITQGMTIDPCNPEVVYVCVPNTSHCKEPECRGLFRSTDAGSTWAELGNFYDCKNIRVDPTNPLHLYQGGGTDDGFHVSYDGGTLWQTPAAFKTLGVETGDVYHVEPDPSSFRHVLVSFHSGWSSRNGDSGIVETLDGGSSWVVHEPMPGGFAGGYAVLFLSNPERQIGDSHTWLFGTQGKGMWRTTDSGKTWKQVSQVNMQHGGMTSYYTQAGTLYVSAASCLLRSTNNGESFEEVKPAGFGAYLSVIGDGNFLYTGNHGGGSLLVARESDDSAWTKYNDQSFKEGPFQMAFDKLHGVLYTANIRGGVWATKVRPP